MWCSVGAFLLSLRGYPPPMRPPASLNPAGDAPPCSHLRPRWAAAPLCWAAAPRGAGREHPPFAPPTSTHRRARCPACGAHPTRLRPCWARALTGASLPYLGLRPPRAGAHSARTTPAERAHSARCVRLRYNNVKSDRNICKFSHFLLPLHPQRPAWCWVPRILFLHG